MSVAGLKHMLPAPTNAWQDELLDDLDELDGSSKIIADTAGDNQDEVSTALVATNTSKVRRAPPYLQRRNWIPRDVLDFDDGGAFPEIHVPQYPLKMGQKGDFGVASGQIVALEVDESGRVKHDAILKQRMRKGTWMHTSFQDMVEKNLDPEDMQKPDDEEVRETTEKTRRELEKLVNTRIQAAKPTSEAVATASKKNAPTFLRYTPQQSGGIRAAGAKQRIVSLVEAQRDPLEPPRHRHKKVPGGIPSPPPPVQHSPPKKLTVQDQQDWKIPACISNWKNPKGFTIPLDKRMAADGSGIQETAMNNDFGQFVEALYIAERNAREEVRRRNALVKQRLVNEKEEQERQLRDLAKATREKRAGIVQDGSDEVQQRNAVREERKREREDDRREAMKRSKTSRDRDRDISEKIALGQAGRLTRQGESIYDARLFNQDKGLGHGMTEDDAYNVYDKTLFAGSSANQMYRPNKDRIAEYQEGGASDALVDSLLQDTNKFKPDKGFKGADAASGSSSRRDRPVEFEREDEVRSEGDEEDPFQLEQFMKEGKRK